MPIMCLRVTSSYGSSFYRASSRNFNLSFTFQLPPLTHNALLPGQKDMTCVTELYQIPDDLSRTGHMLTIVSCLTSTCDTNFGSGQLACNRFQPQKEAATTVFVWGSVSLTSFLSMSIPHSIAPCLSYCRFVCLC